MALAVMEHGFLTGAASGTPIPLFSMLWNGWQHAIQHSIRCSAAQIAASRTGLKTCAPQLHFSVHPRSLLISQPLGYSAARRKLFYNLNVFLERLRWNVRTSDNGGFTCEVGKVDETPLLHETDL